MGGYSEVHDCDSKLIAGFRKCRYLVREGKVFIKNAKVPSRVGCSERTVVYFRNLLFKSDKKKLSFRRIESQKFCSYPGRDLLSSILQVSDIRVEF